MLNKYTLAWSQYGHRNRNRSRGRKRRRGVREGSLEERRRLHVAQSDEAINMIGADRWAHLRRRGERVRRKSSLVAWAADRAELAIGVID